MGKLWEISGTYGKYQENMGNIWGNIRKLIVIWEIWAKNMAKIIYKNG